MPVIPKMAEHEQVTKYPWIPPMPSHQNETTSSDLPVTISPQEIEDAMQDVVGVVNIMSGKIFRDMPEGWGKAFLSVFWGGIYGWARSRNIWFAGSSVGTKYQNNSLLSPNISAWKVVARPFDQETFNHEHLWRDSPAPNWILEFEWRSDVMKARKGIDKITNYYFHHDYVGLNGTTVEEAWLLVKMQDVAIPPYQPPLIHVRLLRWISKLFPMFVWVLLFLDYFLPIHNWSSFIRPKPQRPADLSIPYLAIYFRGQAEPYGYYWLEWNTVFKAPQRSMYATAPSLDVNMLLERMSGRRIAGLH